MAPYGSSGHEIKLYGNHHVDSGRRGSRRAWDVLGDHHLSYCTKRRCTFLHYDYYYDYHYVYHNYHYDYDVAESLAQSKHGLARWHCEG
jgi:hypothetical protein